MPRIYFSLEKNRYFPGESINGVATLVLDAQTTIKEIKLKCEGSSSTRWMEYCQVFTGVESHFKEIIYLLQGKDCTLSPGFYSYPFSIQLPFSGLPFSFSGQWGSIEYHLKVIAKTGLFKDNIRETISFSVEEMLDLNKQDFFLQQPTEIAVFKSIRQLFRCKRLGSVECTFILSKGAFIPGESICFRADIVNNTSEMLSDISVVIEQEIKYKGYGKRGYKERRYDYSKILEVFGPNVDPWARKSWIVPNEEVKMVYAPISICCDIIRISYVAQIKIKLPGGEYLRGSIPIIIGTIPFHAEMQDLLSQRATRKICSQYFGGKKYTRRKKCLFNSLYTFPAIFIIFVLVFCIYLVKTTL